MAELLQHDSPKKQGVRQSKKLSTKIDLTPMVDLGFLLITFFVFTTSITTPTAMKLALPDNTSKDSITTAAGKTISILLGAKNKIYYYNGDSVTNIHLTTYLPEGLRNVLVTKKNSVKTKFGNAQETVVLIKPTSSASYQNIVDAIDEMTINNLTRYVLMDASENETKMIEGRK